MRAAWLFDRTRGTRCHENSGRFASSLLAVDAYTFALATCHGLCTVMRLSYGDTVAESAAAIMIGA